jgi:hypothetical protein
MIYSTAIKFAQLEYDNSVKLAKEYEALVKLHKVGPTKTIYELKLKKQQEWSAKLLMDLLKLYF